MLLVCSRSHEGLVHVVVGFCSGSLLKGSSRSLLWFGLFGLMRGAEVRAAEVKENALLKVMVVRSTVVLASGTDRGSVPIVVAAGEDCRCWELFQG